MVRIVLAHQLIFEQISKESKEKDHADILKSNVDRKNSKYKSPGCSKVCRLGAMLTGLITEGLITGLITEYIMRTQFLLTKRRASQSDMT